MAIARPGDPAKDSNVIQQFNEAFASVADAVRDVLGDEGVLRNLSQDTLDDVETSLLETLVEIDRGFVVFAKRRTIRAKQAVGGAMGAMAKRLTDLEEARAAAAAAAAEPTTAPNATVAFEDESVEQVGDESAW